MKSRNVRLIVLLGVICVSFSSIMTKFSQAPSLAIAFYRLTFSTLILLPGVLIRKREELKGADKKLIGISILSGVFLAFHFATWITSLKYTSIASSTVLVNTHPIFIVIGTYLILKEKISKKVFISITIALIGSIVISTGDSSLGSNVFLGDILALAGAFFYAAYILAGRIARQRLSVLSYTFVVYLTSVVTLGILTLTTSTPLYPYPFKEYLIFIGLAVFSTLLGHSVFNWALEYVKPTYISTAALGEPVFASLWAVIIFHEIPTPWQIIGGLAILLGIYNYIRIEE